MNDRTTQPTNMEALSAGILAKLGPMVEAAVAKNVKGGGGEQRSDPPLEETNGSRIIRDRKFTIKDNMKGIAAARCVRALAFANGNMEKVKYFCSKAFDDELGTEVQKALMASNLTQAGALIPPEYAAEIIELLRARTVVRGAGARVVPMNRGALTIRKQTAGSSASYVGESRNIPTTAPEVGQIDLSSKKLAAIVPISNDLLAFTSGPSADEFVRDDLVLEMAIREDRAFLRDDGSQHTPKGMRNWAVPGNVIPSAGTSSTQIEEDFRDLINALESANVAMQKPAWFMHPTRKNYLRNLRTTNGELIYPEIRGTAPVLYGWPVFVSTSVPANLGNGDDSEIMLAEMTDAIIGEATALEIVTDSSAAYVENGEVQSAFSRDETLIRAISRHDFAMRHGESVAVKTGVAWGG